MGKMEIEGGRVWDFYSFLFSFGLVWLGVRGGW